MANRAISPAAELRRLLREYPDTESIELLIPDACGILKGKRIRKRDFEKACTEQFWFCGGTVLLTALGEIVSGLPGAGDGDPDVPCRFVPGSLAPVPWSRRPMAQGLFRMFGPDGESYFADPRAVLEHALRPLAKMGLRVVMATELEFFLLRGDTDRPAPRAPRIPGIGRRQHGAQVYHPDDLNEVQPFLEDVYAFSEAQRIPADTVISEYGPGQFEINLIHVDDPVLACDHAVLLKRAVKAAAIRHGLVACFMAKPFADLSGNGLHIHMSLVDRNGKNFFSHGRDTLSVPPFSARLRHSVGGLLETMAEATAIFAPNANSYRRLRPENFAPVDTNWGYNHRDVAVRIPQSDEKNLRIEHRVAGADANPYLVTAAVAAGIHHGLKNRCDPGRMVRERERLTLETRIPDRWETALDRFSRSRVLPAYLGEEYCRVYAINRRAESRQYHNTISPLDFEWYLRSV